MYTFAQYVTAVFTFMTRLTRRLSTCGIIGLMAGVLTGSILTVMALIHPGLDLTTSEIVEISLVLGLFSWLVVVFVLFVLVRMTFGSMALAALINCLLAALLTVLVSDLLDLLIWAWLIGIVLGALAGESLCRLFRALQSIGGERA